MKVLVGLDLSNCRKDNIGKTSEEMVKLMTLKEQMAAVEQSSDLS